MTTIQIRPGVLVVLKTSVDGGVTYTRQDLEHEVATDGHDVRRWETTRHIADPEERKTAERVRNRVRTIVTGRCLDTPFGPVYVGDDEHELDAAVAEATEMVEGFNANARTCRVTMRMMRGRIADNDQEAVESVRGEIADLLDQLERATGLGDVRTIRDLASRTVQLRKLLPDSDAANALDMAVVESRNLARRVAREVRVNHVKPIAVANTIRRRRVTVARYLFAAAGPSAGGTTNDEEGSLT